MFRLCSCIARLLYFEGISYGFCDAYCCGHTGSRPEQAVGSLLASLSGKVPARDCDLSCLPSIQNTLNHLGLVPGSLGNRWKKALGSGLGCCHNTLQVCPAYCVVLVRTSTDSHSLHTVFTTRSLVHHHSHMNCVIGMVLVTRRFQTAPLPILPFTAILNVATKEQPDVTSRQSNSFTLVCNWLIAARLRPSPYFGFLFT